LDTDAAAKANPDHIFQGGVLRYTGPESLPFDPESISKATFEAAVAGNHRRVKALTRLPIPTDTTPAHGFVFAVRGRVPEGALGALRSSGIAGAAAADEASMCGALTVAVLQNDRRTAKAFIGSIGKLNVPRMMLTLLGYYWNLAPDLDYTGVYVSDYPCLLQAQSIRIGGDPAPPTDDDCDDGDDGGDCAAPLDRSGSGAGNGASISLLSICTALAGQDRRGAAAKYVLAWFRDYVVPIAAHCLLMRVKEILLSSDSTDDEGEGFESDWGSVFDDQGVEPGPGPGMVSSADSRGSCGAGSPAGGEHQEAAPKSTPSKSRRGRRGKGKGKGKGKGGGKGGHAGARTSTSTVAGTGASHGGASIATPSAETTRLTLGMLPSFLAQHVPGLAYSGR